MFLKYIVTGLIITLSLTCYAQLESYSDHYVNNEGVKIHYVSKGDGPTLVFLHGFPDFWFTWKYQMDKLSEDYKVIGIDLRAYNESEGPSEVEDYQMTKLMSDVLAVIKDNGADKVTLVGNDWGGAIAWQIATYYPDKINGLVACNIPHPKSLSNYLNAHPETADYTKKNEATNASDYWSVDQLMETSGAIDHELSLSYRSAFEASHIQGMLNYYKASYPKPTKGASHNKTLERKIKCPVLMIHGMKDSAFPPGTLNDHWLWIENSFTLHTFPDAGHFVQRAEPEKVLYYIQQWFTDRTHTEE
ncbi:MAG: alpha/beta hydrolase [Cyclobacteriaceae bacterium]